MLYGGSALNRYFKCKHTILFSLIILVKIFLLAVFTSEYTTVLFQPFVATFIDNLTNPWQYYVEHGLNREAFPYHPLMLYILSIFSCPVSLFGFENSYIINFFFKLPLFLSDIAIFYILLKLFKEHYFKVVLFYFLNPIILYSTYIHSQLDIIPTSLLVYALYLLIQKQIKISALVLGLAIATKMHVLLAVPLLLIYIFKKYSLKEVIFYCVITICVLFVFDLPYLFDDGFWEMVIVNQKQSLLFDSFYNIGELKIFLPLFTSIMILSHFFNQRKVNIDLLFFYFGILFTAIIFFVVPSPAWYVWTVPFISIYFIKSNNISKALVLYTFLSFSYLVFFVLFYSSAYIDIIFMNDIIDFKIHNDHFMNISFTLLEVAVAITLFTFYKYGVKSNTVYKKTTNTVIGIGGDSGVGKTSLLNDITLLLDSKLLKLEGDGEHKWERGHTNWESYTHLNPKANYIHNQANAIFELKHNHKIKRSDYDHKLGKFTDPISVNPKEFISLSGLHPFYLPSMRKNIDLKIYVDTDENLRRHWKILRDMGHRGYSIEKIMEQIEKRADDTKKYIYPQKQFADIVIRYYPIKEFEIGDVNVDIEMGLKITFNANIHVESILEQMDCEFEWDYNEDLRTQYAKFRAEPKNDFMMFASHQIFNVKEILDNEYQWLTGYRGFIQLIVLLSLSEKMKGDDNEI